MSTVISQSFTSFAALKNEFIQDPKVSALAKATALLLQSCPPNWIIRPMWIRKTLGYGDNVWRRIAKELINYGYLKLEIGGSGGGKRYIFNAWGESKKAKREILTDRTEKRSVKNSDIAKNNGYKQNRSVVKQKTTTEDVVVDISIFDEYKTEISIKQDEARRLVKKYGPERVNDKLNLLRETMRGTTPIKNPVGWFKSALERNFEAPTPKKPSSRYPSVEDTLKEIEKEREHRKKISTPESREAAAKAIKNMKKMFRKKED